MNEVVEVPALARKVTAPSTSKRVTKMVSCGDNCFKEKSKLMWLSGLYGQEQPCGGGHIGPWPE